MQTWVALALCSMFFAGLTSVIAKFGLKNISGDLAVVVRTAVVLGLVALNFWVFTGLKDLKNLDYKAIGFLSLSGLTTALSWIFYYKAIKIGPISQIALIDKGSIVITLLLSFTLLKEPIGPRILIGMVLILAGLGVMIWK
jgi:bacterial/archaeal transporter family protein